MWISCSAPTNTQTLELISLLDNGQIFEARFTKGDTGLYKGQAHLRVNRWLPEGTPMSYYLDIPPSVSEISSTGADFFGHKLFRENDSWQLYIRAEEYNASAQLSVQSTETISLKEDGWNVDILQPNGTLFGWSSALGRSGIIKGNTVLFHRYGDALLTDERYLILAFGTKNHIGIEYDNRIKQSWGEIQGQNLRDEDIELTAYNNHIEAIVAEKKLRFTPTSKLGNEDLYSHLTSLERLIGSTMIATPMRHVFNGTLTLEEQITLPAICIYYGENPPKRKKP
jgi:hypothetical protein